MAFGNSIELEELLDRKDKIFYSASPLLLVNDFLEIFHQVLQSTQAFNKVVQHTPIPQHRVSYFIERLHGNNTAHRWEKFFKFVLRHYTVNEIGDLLYQGFYLAGLKDYYLVVATTEGYDFLWPKGNNIVISQVELPGPIEKYEQHT